MGKGWLKGLTLVILVVAAVGQAQAAPRKLEFHIARKPLAAAVVDFALQAKLSVSDSGVDFRSALSNKVDGAYTVQDALALMLSGTGYDFDAVDSSTLRIRLAQIAPGIAPPAPGIETVVVTAMKRSEVAQTLPYSISVTGGRQLESFAVKTSRGLQGRVAGLTATNLGPGQDKLFVRGLTDSVLPGVSEPMVGLYLDETRIADDAPDPDLSLVDIDRVEIVRGPQGSLYGAGSLSGLVKIITHKPVFDAYESSASATVSSTKDSGISFAANGTVNLPLANDALALRLVGYVQRDAGYIDDLRLGLSDVNRSTTTGGRATLAWQASANWLITLSAVYQTADALDSQYYDAGLKPLNRDNYLREPRADRFAQIAVTAEGSLSWADVTSTTAVTDRHLDNRFDATLSWPQLTGFPLGPSPFDLARGITAFTHETRLVSTGGGRWKWLAGVFVSHRDEDYRSSLAGPNLQGDTIVARSETREDRADELAVFGEATYDLSDTWSLTAGARVFEASRHVTAMAKSIISGGDFQFSGANSQVGVTPKFVLSYRPDAAMLFYAQVSEGYRLGGINIDGPAGVLHDGNGDVADSAFDSDILWNYEVGLKTALFGNRLIANAAAYFVVWNNVQTDQIAPDGSFYIVNAGRVNDLGFEMDLTAQPLEHLTLQANVFWNHVRLINPNPLLVQTEGLLPGAPQVSFGISGRYDIPLDDDFDAFAIADFSYIGRSHIGFDENTSPPMGGYHLADIRFGVSRDNWEASLFANNVFDEEENTFAFGNPFAFNVNRQITPLRPRTIGVTLTFRQ